MKDRYLAIYLRDHYAMAQAGIDFMNRLVAENKGNVIGQHLTDVVAELEEDSHMLRQILKALHIDRSPLKTMGARIGEKLGRFKLNGRWLGYSPLSRLVELEGAMAAVMARRGLWMTLKDARVVHPALADFPFDTAIGRCDRQIELLYKLHAKAARTMLKESALDPQESPSTDRDRSQANGRFQ